MKTKESLKIQVESFSELKKGWNGDNEEEVTVQSIMTAHKVIDGLPDNVDIQSVDVFPMRDGGVQIDVGEYKEIEVFDYTVTEIQYDNNFNIINRYVYELN